MVILILYLRHIYIRSITARKPSNLWKFSNITHAAITFVRFYINILYFQDLKYGFSYQDKYFSLSMYVHIANIEHFYTRLRNIHS